MEPSLPTKKTGRDKDGSPDTKEGSDEVGSWRTQDQDWSEIANALDKAKVDIEDRTGNFCEHRVPQKKIRRMSITRPSLVGPHPWMVCRGDRSRIDF